jgi:hypothetical protein
MSFMRGVVENAIRNMSPEERQSALHTVTEQVVAMMSEEERMSALVEIVGQLARSVPEHRIEEVMARLK